VTFGDERFKFDGADFGAVLLALRALLRLFVLVEGATGARGHAVKEIGGRPEDVFEVGFEPCVAEHGGDGVENGGHAVADAVGVGQRSRIGFAGEGPVAEELQLFEHESGRAVRRG
jgi:hypothetical protein